MYDWFVPAKTTYSKLLRLSPKPLFAPIQYFVEKIAGMLRDQSEFADVTLVGDDE